MAVQKKHAKGSVRPASPGGRFTDARVPDPAIRSLFDEKNRWQRWLDVEAALAAAEADVGVVPRKAAKAIAQAASMKRLDADRIRAGIAATSHPLMALITELSNEVGEPHGGWVHWGATTQNIIQTGFVLVLREVHTRLLDLLGQVFAALGDLADRGAYMACAGRTHGQHAVPITFGLKAAAWIDELSRHADRLGEVEKRVFTALMGGAVGNFESFGGKGIAIQAGVARRLGLLPMAVPLRSISDSFAEYTCILGLLAATGGKIAAEIYTLMKTEYGEAGEPLPEGTIGSSTMPHKRNPQLAQDCMTISAQIRALAPLAMEGMMHDHEVNGANFEMTLDAVERSCILTGDMLARLNIILSGLELNPQRMRANLDLTGGLITSEAVMLELGQSIGRQEAHDVVYKAAQTAARGKMTFSEALCADPHVTSHLDRAAIKRLLDPSTKTGLSVSLSRTGARRARKLAGLLTSPKRRS